MLFFLGFHGPFRFFVLFRPNLSNVTRMLPLGWIIPSCYLESVELEDLLVAFNQQRREIITVRGHSYVSRLPDFPWMKWYRSFCGVLPH
jgi:hypothetical protein